MPSTGTDIALNTILYGPPGTGKTYHTVLYAVAIIEKKQLDAIRQEPYEAVLARYNQYKEAGRIAFTTFHQPYGYEEFIEGIKPILTEEDEDKNTCDVHYDVQPGVFKRFCDAAASGRPAQRANLGIRENPTIWKVSLNGTGDNPIRTDCLNNGHIRIAWDNYGQEITDRTVFTSGGKTVLNAFINTMQIGDIVFSCYTATLIDAIGVVTGSYEWHEEYPELKRLRKVHWIVKGIREDIFERNGNTAMTLSSVYRLSNISLSDVYQILQKYNCAPAALQVSQDSDNYVFIIDEINRGNISKIFGELITLIEPNKRKGQSEEAAVLLPNSQKLFGVPKNVYLIGTMNTADRSIAAIDTALHRRFSEVEMMPDPTVLKGVCVEDVAIDRMLDRLNQKIIALYDRDHTLGHAYFMPLKKDPTVKTLARVFRSSILPLLQEYFYDDYEKIRKVLGDNRKQDEETQFILAKPIEYQDLFGEDCSEDTPVRYEVNEAAFENIDAYRMI